MLVPPRLVPAVVRTGSKGISGHLVPIVRLPLQNLISAADHVLRVSNRSVADKDVDFSVDIDHGSSLFVEY